MEKQSRRAFVLHGLLLDCEQKESRDLQICNVEALVQCLSGNLSRLLFALLVAGPGERTMRRWNYERN